MKNIDALVEEYTKLRDAKKEVDRIYKENTKKLDVRMKEIETELLGTMNEMGVQSVRTSAGTAYTSTTAQYGVTDWDAFGQLVLERGDLDLVQKRVSKTAAMALEEEMGTVPPGLNKTVIKKVNIRVN